MIKIGLIAHNQKKLALDCARKVISYAQGKRKNGEDIDILVSDTNTSKLNSNGFEYRKIEEMDVDMIISSGGDGTLLRTLQHTEKPVIGINAGSLGFLTEIPPDNINEALDHLVNGKYQIETRSKLKTILNGDELPDATNEAVIATSIPSKIQEFEFFIDMEWAQTIRADGIIISTPTGSTSYALSAGGCVLDPRLNALEIIPISPFRINSRPIIIPDISVISLRIAHKTRGANLVLDGYFRTSIKSKDELLFTRSKKVAKFIRFDMNFYERYRDKIIRERPIINKKGKY
jgi:NAD+ kinase